MKKLAILIILAMMLTVPAYAQLGDTDNSSFTIQNLGTAVATVTVTFYSEAGVASTPNPILTGVSNPFTLASGAKQEIHMPSVLNLADGRYSVVIESTEPIGVIANLIGRTGGGAPFYNGSYSGFDMGATTIYFPSTQFGYYNWNSLMSVQNTTASPINVDVFIYNEFGAQVATKNYTNVPAFSSVHLDLETQGAGMGLAAGLNGSAKVVCSGACVGTDNQTAAGGFTQSYNAFLSGGDTLFAPALYNNYYTWNASLKVQNIGTGPTSVDVIYYVAGGAVCDPPAETVAANQALYHYLPGRWAGWGCASAADKVIAAKITSSAEDIVGVVNAANPKKQAQTYGTAAQTDGANTVGLPVIMNNYYGWNTSFTCQNVANSGDAAVTFTYSPGGCPGGGCSYTLTPGAAKEIYQPGATSGLGGATGLFAVTVTSTGAPIACISNETNPANTNSTLPSYKEGDWSMAYNGFGQ